MKRYIYLDENKKVINIIPEFDKTFPDVPIQKRYSKDFLSKCIIVSDPLVEIEQHYIYHPEDNSFEKPVVEESTEVE